MNKGAYAHKFCLAVLSAIREYNAASGRKNYISLNKDSVELTADI